ncbi:MAG: amidohydrolase [Anaerolineae bacterium]|nr:amidohydrolase [Anaerolineae bacterium]MCB9105071.1 amidohydrolase [Anaerolineales bacterium]
MKPIVDNADILQQAKALHAKIRAWRRQIHRYPELSFTETRTAGLIASALFDLGIEPETEVAKTGVVGVIKGGDGPVVGLRADMDALPITEQNGADFDSTRPGLMHACGHDAHTAMLLGAATILKALADRGQLPGTVRLLFQPSEEDQDDEGKSGGMRMVEEGALDGLDAVFGLHVDTGLPVGTVATRPGPMMASADTFMLTLYGQAAHAARPHQGLDTIALAAHVIQAVHQIVSRRLDPIGEGVITIGTIQGGTKDNIIAGTVTMTGTIRSFTPENRDLLYTELRRACQIVEPLGGRFELDLRAGYPPLANDEAMADLMLSAARDLLGDEQVRVAEKIMAAEDFSFMAQAAPGSFLRLGVYNPAWPQIYPVHTPTFRIDEDALPIGAAALVAMALARLRL